MARTKWPEEVPVLEADDFCRCQFTNGERHCLSGWCGVVFSTKADEAVYTPVGKEAYDAILESIREIADRRYANASVCPFNDHETTNEMLARVWNRATAKLGYVVGSPEAKHLKRK